MHRRAEGVAEGGIAARVTSAVGTCRTMEEL